MIYIPKEWLRDYSNQNRVYEILEKLNVDLIADNSYTEAEVVKELEALNEDIIIEKLKAKAFILGA